MVQLITGLLRAKISAIIIGPEGVGIVNQLRTILTSINNLSLLQMQSGAVRLIAEHNAKHAYIEIAKIIKTFIMIILPITIFIYILGIVFSGKISELFLGKSGLENYFMIAFLAFPFLMFKVIPDSILTGFKKIKYLATSNILATIISFLIFAPLVLLFNLKGAIISLPLSFISIFIIYTYFVKRKVINETSMNLTNIMKTKFDKTHFRNIFSFISVGIIVGPVGIASRLLIRSLLATNVGIKAIGIYNPVLAWSSLFQGFLIPTIGKYFFPRMSEANNNNEIRHITNDMIRICSFFILPFLVLGIAYRSFFIELFYSTKFLEASNYLPYHFLGILFIVNAGILGNIFLATGRLREYVVIAVPLNILNILIIYFFSNKYGLYAWAFMFLLSPFITGIIYYVYLSLKINFYVFTKNKILILYVISSTLFVTFNPFIDRINYALAPLLVLSGYFFMEKNEINYLLHLIKKNIFRANR